jgi:hypothetical protein
MYGVQQVTWFFLFLKCVPKKSLDSHSIAQDMHQHVFDGGGPLARAQKAIPALLTAAPADAAVLAMLRSGHLPDPPLEGLPGYPCSQGPDNPYTDSTCTWCHSM